MAKTLSLVTKTINLFYRTKGNSSLRKLDKITKDPVKESNKMLLSILKKNEKTEYGQKYNFKNINNYADYIKNVPLSHFDDYEPYIKRTAETGEQGLLTNDKIVAFAHTSGSVGTPKKIPVVKKAVNKFVENSVFRVMGSANKAYKFSHNGKHIPAGKGFMAAELSFYISNGGIKVGGISSIAMNAPKKVVESFTTAPCDVLFPKESMDMKYMKTRFALAEKNVAFIAGAFMPTILDLFNYIESHWEMLCDDIEKGLINDDIKVSKEMRENLAKYIKPNPERANELREIFKNGFSEPFVTKVWPKCGFLSAIGSGGFLAYTRKIRKFTGKLPIDYEVFGASESVLGTCMNVEEDNFVFLPGVCYYEFIPEDGEEKDITTIDNLVIGKSYELVVTNLSGLYRYRIGDVVTITGKYNNTPTFRFSHRKSQIVSLAGEKLNESNFAWVLDEFRKETGCEILDYSVYADKDSYIPRIVMYVEPSDDMDLSKLNYYEKVMDQKLCDVNLAYKGYIAENVLNPVKLFILQKETYALYRDIMVTRGASSNQVKPPKIIDNPFKEKFFNRLIEK